MRNLLRGLSLTNPHLQNMYEYYENEAFMQPYHKNTESLVPELSVVHKRLLRIINT
ncbi:hypothetical protein AHMF7616_01717 [Adhaeribacter pallidiroseus]|uniref:Uncharacterized protein n=1 Tax=Adhaeribacter pallidiroseus TaxID=2072847 RepID=A0A369QIM1_9BACT|nr:hypothetical protein AHMF7616_01717 [Adhaeribacter pallidiroseus]